MRIIHISDLHVSSPNYSPEWGETVKNDINNMKPDLLLITGDLTNEGHIHKYRMWEDYFSQLDVKNSIIVCDFFMLGHERIAPLIDAATGIPMTKEKMYEIGERIHHLARLYNLRTGRTHADDTLPGRFFSEPILAGMMEGKVIDRNFFEGQLQDYYKLRGWDEEGRPTPETLEKMGL